MEEERQMAETAPMCIEEFVEKGEEFANLRACLRDGKIAGERVKNKLEKRPHLSKGS